MQTGSYNNNTINSLPMNEEEVVDNVLDVVLEDIDSILDDSICRCSTDQTLEHLASINNIWYSASINNNNNNSNDNDHMWTRSNMGRIPQICQQQPNIENSVTNMVQQQTNGSINVNNHPNIYQMNNRKDYIMNHTQLRQQIERYNEMYPCRLHPQKNRKNSDMSPNSSYSSLVSLQSNDSKNSYSHSANTSSDSDKVRHFEWDGNTSKLQLKNFVFISKDCTYRLSEYIVPEEWGKECGLLYKYIDYIFRCQAFKRQIIIVHGGKYLIFHSGLQRRSDKQLLYVLLVPNQKYKAQKWRVQFGAIKNSFVSKSELLSKINQSYLISDYLPKRTKFYSSLSELLFDDTCSIEVCTVDDVFV